MSTAPETVVLAYGGRRQITTGGLAHAWFQLDDLEHPLIFDKVKAVGVGGLYEVRVKRGENGAINSAFLDPEFTGDRFADDEQVAAWHALDRDAWAKDQHRKAEARLRRGNDDFDAAIRPLLALTAKARTYDEVDAILAEARRRAIREWAR